MMQMLLRGWGQSKNSSKQKRTSAMHKTSDKEECIKLERLVLSCNSATDV